MEIRRELGVIVDDTHSCLEKGRGYTVMERKIKVWGGRK